MFTRGLTVFRFRGIPIRLHVSLLLFVPYVALVSARQFSLLAAYSGIPLAAPSAPPLLWGSVLAIGLFASILVHELAHVAVALRSGARIDSVTLMMLGGVTQMATEVPPEREARMAFAGPLTSFGIGIAAWGLYAITPGPGELRVALLAFAVTNLVLAAFNLLPAFPMDGGRVLRGLLVRRIGRDRATRVATSLGRLMAVVFGVLGVLGFNVILLLIAGFIYLGAAGEQARHDTRDMLKGVPVHDLMTDRLGEARPDETAGDVARRLLRHDLVGARVVEPPIDGAAEPRTVGVVMAWDLARRAARGEGDAPLSAAMRTDLPRAHPGDDAERTLSALASGSVPAVVVVDDAEREVLGLVTTADLERATALGGLARDRRAPPPPV